MDQYTFNLTRDKHVLLCCLTHPPKSVFAILFAPTIWCVKRQKYASDISREKFAEIEPELRKVRRKTKPATLDLYEVFCAVLYLLRTGCQWRYLPPDFPKWQSVYAYWRKWSKPDEHGITCLPFEPAAIHSMICFEVTACFLRNQRRCSCVSCLNLPR